MLANKTLLFTLRNQQKLAASKFIYSKSTKFQGASPVAM